MALTKEEQYLIEMGAIGFGCVIVYATVYNILFYILNRRRQRNLTREPDIENANITQ
jgi:hypothetical protein